MTDSPAPEAGGSVWSDGWRLSVGTLTALPVRPPSRVDRPRAAVAMAVAPLTALLLALPAALVTWLGWLLGSPTVLVAVLVVTLLAIGNRGLHLDGLADTADGLAAPKDAEGRLAVMRTGDVGPVGAAALVLVLGAQVAGLSVVAGGPWGWLVVVAVVCASRAALALVCLRPVPAARSAGLGHGVASSVPWWAALVVWVVTAAGLVGAVAWSLLHSLDAGWYAYAPLSGVPGAATDGADWSMTFGVSLGAESLVQPVVAVVLAAAVVGLLVRRAVRALGGVTGDVCGAAVELALAVLLVALAA